MRLLAGKNADGTDKTEAQKVQDSLTTGDIGIDANMTGSKDYGNVNGGTQHQGGPIGEFWNWALGVNNKPKEGDFTGKLEGVATNAAGQLPYDTSGLDSRHLPGFGKHLADIMTSDYGQQIASLSSGPGNSPYTLDSPYKMQFMSPDNTQNLQPITNNTTTNNLTSSPINNITVNAPGVDAKEVVGLINEEVQKQVEAGAKQVFQDILGTARAATKEVQ